MLFYLNITGTLESLTGWLDQSYKPVTCPSIRGCMGNPNLGYLLLMYLILRAEYG